MLPTLGRHHPLLKEVRRLHQARDRRQAGRFLLEGVRVLEAALDAGFPLETLLVGADLYVPLTERAAAAGARVHRVDPEVLDALAPTRTCQGLLAVALIPPDPAPEAWDDLVLYLEDISDPGNLGTLLRGARAAAPCTVVVAGGTDPYGPKAVRASAGSLFSVRLARCQPLQPGDLRAMGYQPVATRPRGGRNSFQAELPLRLALVLGSEAHGLAPAWAEEPALTLPMASGCESLNVAMAGTLLLYEYRRRHGWPDVSGK